MRERNSTGAQAGYNPFHALVQPPVLGTASDDRATVVNAGRPKQAVDEEKLRARIERRRANERARYQRRKNDPVERERMRAWAARHKDARLAAQRAARATPEGRAAHLQAQRDYYAKNRVQILARAKERRDAIKALLLSMKGGEA